MDNKKELKKENKNIMFLGLVILGNIIGLAFGLYRGRNYELYRQISDSFFTTGMINIIIGIGALLLNNNYFRLFTFASYYSKKGRRRKKSEIGDYHNNDDDSTLGYSAYEYEEKMSKDRPMLIFFGIGGVFTVLSIIFGSM